MLVLFYEIYLTKQIQFQFNQIDILRQIVKQEKKINKIYLFLQKLFPLFLSKIYINKFENKAT